MYCTKQASNGTRLPGQPKNQQFPPAVVKAMICWTLLLQYFDTSVDALSTITPTSQIPPLYKILILPGFGNDARDYVLPGTPEGSLVQSLLQCGWAKSQVRIMPLRRAEWLNVFLRGAFDPLFWQGRAPATRPAFRWYLDRVAEEIETSAPKETDRVVLLGHSAGGWLCRSALGLGTVASAADDFQIALEKVCGVVTLGAPHEAPPPSVFDVTRGALRLTNAHFPGAYHQANGIFYVTVVGNAVQGAQQQRSSPFEPNTETGFAYASYLSVCGDGTAAGDGVVPVCSGHLVGARQITLDGVFHSINRPTQWYGAATVIGKWHDSVENELRKAFQVQGLNLSDPNSMPLSIKE